MFAIAIQGFTQGHPAVLAQPYDRAGNACGADSAYVDYPYVYFVTPVHIR